MNYFFSILIRRGARPWISSLSFLVFLMSVTVGYGQINLIHQEGFNDDGDGTRYTMTGRGQEVLPVGPGMWEHNFNVDVIGLPAVAAAKRAAILWTSAAIEIDEDFTPDALMIWDNLINYMIDDQPEQRIGFFPNITSPTADFLSLRLEEAGHTVFGLDVIPADPTEVDLIINSEEAVPDPGTLFATFTPEGSTEATGYPVPLITYNAGNHDDELVSSIGAVTSTGITQVSVVEANQDHPVLGGKTGNIQWLDDFFADTPLQGIGASMPAGSKVLATYEDGGVTLPALLIVEEGEPLLGAFAPIPEGEGYIVGGDMNERFPDEGGEFTSELMPRTLTLNPVDISGLTGVKVSVALAATDVDFEAPDFLSVSYSEDPAALPEDFITLARFDGMAPGVLTNPDLGPLNPNEFTDFTFQIPDEVNNLVIRFEAFSTFPNEVLGIDNVRIFTGEELSEPTCQDIAAMRLPGDADGDGEVAFLDFLALANNFGTDAGYEGGDFDCDGEVAFLDFLVLANNFGATAAGAAAAVPEPSSALLVGLGAMLMGLVRRQRRR